MSLPGGTGPGTIPPPMQGNTSYQAPGNAGYQTQIYPGYAAPGAQSLDGATLSWTISALVLGLLCLVLYAVISAASFVIPGAYLGVLPRFVAGLGFFSAAGVVIGSIAVMSRQEWGRKLVIIATVGALITLALDLSVALQPGSAPPAPHSMIRRAFPTPGPFGTAGVMQPPVDFNSARPMGFPGAPLSTMPGMQRMPFPGPQPMGFPGSQPASPDTQTAQSAAFSNGFHFGAVYGDLAKMAYCLGLLMFMLSAKAKLVTRR